MRRQQEREQRRREQEEKRRIEEMDRRRKEEEERRRAEDEKRRNDREQVLLKCFSRMVGGHQMMLDPTHEIRFTTTMTHDRNPG